MPSFEAELLKPTCFSVHTAIKKGFGCFSQYSSPWIGEKRHISQTGGDNWIYFMAVNSSHNEMIWIVLSAIYNYDSNGEQELCLQVGDPVHILEKFEGECKHKTGPNKSLFAFLPRCSLSNLIQMLHPIYVFIFYSVHLCP